jgi:ribose transport system substrate-binding protein
MEKADAELKLADAGLTAVLEPNDGTPEGQLNKLRQYGTQSDVAGVAVSVVDSKVVAIAEEMRNLQKKGIKVVCFDSDIDRARFLDARSAFIGTNNLDAGKELGAAARHLLPDGTSYVTFVGKKEAQNAADRISGFAQGAGEKFKSADSMPDDFDRTKARDNVRNAIRNHPEVACLVGIYSYNAPAIVDVVTQLKNREKMTIATFDAEPDAVKQMEDGMIDVMVVQDPFQMGYQSVKMLKALIGNDQPTIKEMFPKLGQPEGDIYDTGLKVVVPEKTPLKKEQFQPATKFLKISEFRDWLKQWDLTGS